MEKGSSTGRNQPYNFTPARTRNSRTLANSLINELGLGLRPGGVLVASAASRRPMTMTTRGQHLSSALSAGHRVTRDERPLGQFRSTHDKLMDILGDLNTSRTCAKPIISCLNSGANIPLIDCLTSSIKA